ncbi:MAG TPA: Rpp14/Pop5 family protein [Candidatus Nanoarchaeia archaeon]|nr:Rpp14/Pop5 family protein [Candidatus Nanoarchaeia archaeon]
MRLLPSLRQKKRYVVFEILSDRSFSFQEIKESIYDAMHQFLGSWGSAHASPMIITGRFNEQKQRLVMKVNNTAVDELKMALVLCTHIQHSPIIIRSLVTSGTLKKAGQYLNS